MAPSTIILLTRAVLFVIFKTNNNIKTKFYRVPRLIAGLVQDKTYNLIVCTEG